MTKSLLVLSIGPVQEFIAAARRTRDLWFGSYLLSEISKAAARAVKDAGGNLVFPHPGGDLQRGSDLNVANVILAEVEGIPRDPFEKAKEAARAEWKEFAESARKQAEKDGMEIRKDLWDRQVDDVIEIYAAWTPIPAGKDGHRTARGRVMRLLAARKNCRDFLFAKGEFGVPKSSLDGLRESVLPEQEKRGRGFAVKPGEQLCAVGLTKRLAGGREAFPSVSRIAADPWIRGLLRSGARELDALRGVCEQLVRIGALSRVPLAEDRQGGNPEYESFPFEGGALFASRLADLAKQAEAAGRKDNAKPLLERAKPLLAELCRRHREPLPYLAVLVADGDRMGKAIDSIRDAETHRKFSGELSKFAGDAHRIVREHSGVCVYSGGDDVLAFLPVDRALPCARALHESFGILLEAFGDASGAKPTLSVGIAVGHVFEDLEDLLAFGRDAETMAKKGRTKEEERNGLAVVVRARGGDKCAVREQWEENVERQGVPASLDRRLHYWAEHFVSGRLPNKFPYELRQCAEFYAGWDQAADAMRADVVRIFGRKDVGLDEKDKEIASTWIAARAEERGMASVADELMVAQWIGAAIEQAGGITPSHDGNERRSAPCS